MGQRQYAHLSLADRVDFILQDRQGDQAIRASIDKGIRKGWDPGPPVWDPGIPIGHMRAKQANEMIVIEAVERRWHPTVHSRWLVGFQAHSDKLQEANQLEPNQFRQRKDRQPHHKPMEPQTPVLRLHWILRKTAQDRMVSKWAVSTDPLETRIATGDPDMINHGESAAITRGRALWNHWEQLSGGGPIQTNLERTTSTAPRLDDGDQAPDLIIRPIQTTRTEKEAIPCKANGGEPTKGNGHSPVLASMGSLRGPLARQNRANFNSSQVDSTRENTPREIRYPHNAKRWRLGVGRVQGERHLEGVFAMGKVDTEGVVFTTGQLICPFRGHQQSKRPTHLNNHAWAHNGIPEGTE